MIAALSGASCTGIAHTSFRLTHPSKRDELLSSAAEVKDGWFSVTELTDRRICVDHAIAVFDQADVVVQRVGQMLEQAKKTPTTFICEGREVPARLVQTMGPEPGLESPLQGVAGLRWCAPNQGPLVSATARQLIVKTWKNTVSFDLSGGRPRDGAWGARGGRIAVQPRAKRQADRERSRERFRHGLARERTQEKQRLDRLTPAERERERRQCFRQCKDRRREARYNPQAVWRGCIDDCWKKYPREY